MARVRNLQPNYGAGYLGDDIELFVLALRTAEQQGVEWGHLERLLLMWRFQSTPLFERDAEGLSGMIYGQVVSSSSNHSFWDHRPVPVKGAAVRVGHQSVVTDGEGYFTFWQIPLGRTLLVEVESEAGERTELQASCDGIPPASALEVVLGGPQSDFPATSWSWQPVEVEATSLLQIEHAELTGNPLSPLILFGMAREAEIEQNLRFRLTNRSGRRVERIKLELELGTAWVIQTDALEVTQPLDVGATCDVCLPTRFQMFGAPKARLRVLEVVTTTRD